MPISFLKESSIQIIPSDEPEKLSLRVMTYNIAHGSLGLDKVLEVLKGSQVDVITLNEVDNGRSRGNFVSQAAWLAEQLGMYYYFGPAKDDTYGNALLSRYPLTQVNNQSLNSLKENRACLTGLIQIKDSYLRFFVTHLGLSQSERLEHLEEIRAFMDSYPEKNKLLLGDFNANPLSPEIRLITNSLKDTFAEKGQGEGTTYHPIPGARINYIFASEGG